MQQQGVSVKSTYLHLNKLNSYLCPDMSMMLQKTIEGYQISFSERGYGDTVVLLHGYLESQHIWNGFADILAEHFRVITVDLPGHGNSDTPDRPLTMEELARRVYILLTELGEKKVLMVGHSLGGYVALAFLEHYGRMLAGYVLFHSHPLPDSPEAIQRREREISVVKAGKKRLMYPFNIEKMFSPANLTVMAEAIKRSNMIASQTPDEGIIAILRGMIARPSRERVMQESGLPVLWILGLHDQYIDYQSVTESVKLPQEAVLAMLENSGHLGFVEEREASLTLITDFAVTAFGKKGRA